MEGNVVDVSYEEIDPPLSADLEPLSLIASHETEYDIEDTDRNVNLALAAQEMCIRDRYYGIIFVLFSIFDEKNNGQVAGRDLSLIHI